MPCGSPKPPGFPANIISISRSTPGIPACSLSEKLSPRYPREMTIVLQHQYWNLHVFDDRFEVELSFDNVPEQLVIPFDAVKGFLDPAVQFGLQFEQAAVERRPRETEPAKAAAAPAAAPRPEPATAGEATADEAAEGETQDEPAKVVSLDKFRKK